MVTRGTTNPNRLRRVDNWIAVHAAPICSRDAADPLVVDLGLRRDARSPRSSCATGWRRVRPDVRGGRRRRSTRPGSPPPHRPRTRPASTFARGGFELAGLRPAVVRAFNVLRQYDEGEVDRGLGGDAAALAPGGALVEGTCDELGRLASWVLLDGAGPRTLTLAARLSTWTHPATLAERLPKALIHHNVPGEPVHALLHTLDKAWRDAAPYATFGPRQRWLRAAAAVRAAGWPVLDRPARWRLGELTVAWSAVG